MSRAFSTGRVDVPNSNNKLFELIFSRVLASHRGGPGSIPGRDLSILGFREFREFREFRMRLHAPWSNLFKRYIFFYIFFTGSLAYFSVIYSTLLHLQPLGFYCVGECWNLVLALWARTCKRLKTGSSTNPKAKTSWDVSLLLNFCCQTALGYLKNINCFLSLYKKKEKKSTYDRSVNSCWLAVHFPRMFDTNLISNPSLASIIRMNIRVPMIGAWTAVDLPSTSRACLTMSSLRGRRTRGTALAVHKNRFYLPKYKTADHPRKRGLNFGNLS